MLITIDTATRTIASDNIITVEEAGKALSILEYVFSHITDPTHTPPARLKIPRRQDYDLDDPESVNKFLDAYNAAKRLEEEYNNLQ